MGTYKDLLLYKKNFALAMDIYTITKRFPKEEMFSLTDQIRRSSRSANLCTIEAYRKRRFPNHFISKLTDVDMENSEPRDGWSFRWLASISQKRFMTNYIYYLMR